jgi:CubicO group peptidase (beta-lactamase class C family)
VHILLRNFRHGTHELCREIGLFLILLFVIGLSSVTSLAGQRQSSPSDAEVAARIRSYLAPFKETGNLTGAVLIARHGRVLLRQAYGSANYELQVPNSPRTRFHIASVSKAFTAMAILQLQEQGRLKLSDPLSRFLPDFPRGDDSGKVIGLRIRYGAKDFWASKLGTASASVVLPSNLDTVGLVF